jgi:hypothetical protein
VTVVRIARRLLREVAEDLHRPHAFAAERVGFLFARWVRHEGENIVLSFAYRPVADEHYIDDPSVGARFNGAAIRAALQSTLNWQCACLHVHAHPPTMPYFGRLDLSEQEKLIPSFLATVPSAPHGALLLYGDHATARLWSEGAFHPARVVAVGFPMIFSEVER